jgi:hypothetical protein
MEVECKECVWFSYTYKAVLQKFVEEPISDRHYLISCPFETKGVPICSHPDCFKEVPNIPKGNLIVYGAPKTKQERVAGQRQLNKDKNCYRFERRKSFIERICTFVKKLFNRN